MITVKIITIASLCASFFSLGFTLSTLILWDGGGLDSRIVRRFRRRRRERRRRRGELPDVEGIKLAYVKLSLLEKEQRYEQNDDT